MNFLKYFVLIIFIATSFFYFYFFVPSKSYFYTKNNILYLTNAKYYIENFPWIINNRTLLSKNIKLQKYHQPKIYGNVQEVDDCLFPRFDYTEFARRHQLYLITFKDTFATSKGTFIKNGNFYSISHNCKKLAHQLYLNLSAPRKFEIPYKSYGIVVSLTHDNFGTFGHWLSEIFPSIFLLPKNVIQKGYIICRNAHSFHYEGYEIVGFSRDRILSGDNLTVFGSTVYTFSCLTCMHLSPPSITFSKSEIIRILKLKKIEPYNYVLFNRIDNRKLINFNEIVNTVISRHPNLNWTLKYYNNGTLSEQINSWYLTKFIFGTHSSAIFGLYFMQPNSIAAVVEWMSCFHSLQHLAVLSGLYFVHIREPKMTTAPYKIDLQRCVGLIEYALRYGNII